VVYLCPSIEFLLALFIFTKFLHLMSKGNSYILTCFIIKNENFRNISKKLFVLMFQDWNLIHHLYSCLSSSIFKFWKLQFILQVWSREQVTTSAWDTVFSSTLNEPDCCSSLSMYPVSASIWIRRSGRHSKHSLFSTENWNFTILIW